MKLKQSVLAVALLSSLAGPVLAAPPSTPTSTPIEQLLRALDEVPADRSKLDALSPDARGELDRIARDTTRDTWTRLRALSLLSFYPEAKTRATLEALVADADPDVREQAIYTYGRGFGAVADKALVAFLARHAAGPDAVVADSAVRALRWVDHDDARLALERLAANGPDKLRSLAKTTLAKRAQRLQR